MSTKARETGLVLYEKTEKVATITLNRPDKLNTLDENVYSELDAALSTPSAIARFAPSSLQAPVAVFQPALTSKDHGLRVCWRSGRNAIRFRTGNFGSGKFLSPSWRRFMAIASAAGLELALWCDIVIAAEDAQFGQPEVRSGSFVATIVPWLMGPAARETVHAFRGSYWCP